MSQSHAVEVLIHRIEGGQAPLPLRQAAARGALPLPRPVLARLFVHLQQKDLDEGVRAAAKASLDGLGPDALVEILGEPECAPEVLRHFASKAARDASLAERLAFHPAVPNEVLAVLAAEGNATVLDLVLTNQQRLLTAPGLLDRLTTNPALRPDQRGKILDILDRLSREPTVGADPRADAAILLEDLPPEEAARLLDVDVGELFAASEILGGDEFERSEDPEVRSAYQRILRLSPGQKAMLAMKGGREERMILIRDTNKVVALSVLKNPRLTDQDVDEVARMRNVSEEVLRAVGANREWAKRYAVMLSLVKNPRTPQSISVNFVARLGVKDVKDLSRDKNVPELVRRMAKRTHELRTQKTLPTDRKK